MNKQNKCSENILIKQYGQTHQGLETRMESHNLTHAITHVIRDHALIQDYEILNLLFQNNPL